MAIKKESKQIISLATSHLRQGKLVAVMTETVYGLAVDASNCSAIKALYKIKKRPAINPLIIHINSIEMAEKIAHFNEEAKTLASIFWPGPLTLILKKKKSANLSTIATSGLDTVGIRMPSSRVFLDLISSFGKPIAAPSANLSGYISSTRANHVEECFGKKIELIIDSKSSKFGLESTIINLSDKNFKIERIGVIDSEIIFKKAKIKIKSESKKSKTKIIAPGQLMKHYSPKTPIRLNAKKASQNEAFLVFGNKFPDSSNSCLNLSKKGNLDEAAFNLFDFLRKLDKLDKDCIAISAIPKTGLGKVINEKLKRANLNE